VVINRKLESVRTQFDVCRVLKTDTWHPGIDSWDLGIGFGDPGIGFGDPGIGFGDSGILETWKFLEILGPRFLEKTLGTYFWRIPGNRFRGTWVEIGEFDSRRDLVLVGMVECRYRASHGKRVLLVPREVFGLGYTGFLG